MAKRRDPNSAQLEEFAERCSVLLPEVTVVGGCAAGLLITDPGAASVRATLDIDVVVGAVTYVEYQAFCERLAAQGFGPSTEPGAPLCRWTDGGLRIDVMAVDDHVIGFGNRWYASALRTRASARLPSGAVIHHIDAPHFVATKLEAFIGRGRSDHVASHDLEDIVRVLDGRPGVSDEIRLSPRELRSFVARKLGECLHAPHFLEAMPGYFPGAEEGAARSRLVERRMRVIIGGGGDP